MLFLRSFGFWVASVLFILLSFLPLPFLFVKKSWTICYSKWAVRQIINFASFFCGIKWKVEGAEVIPKEPFIICGKHNSAWETFFCGFYFNVPVYIFKRILLFIPIFGWYMARAGMVGIKRSGGQKKINQIAEVAVDVIKNKKRSLIIFPQGTRVRNEGYSLQKYPYKRGIAGIAASLRDVPVLLFTHNAVTYFGRSFFSIKRPGVVTVRLISAITMGSASEDEFLQKIQSTIEAETIKLFK